ncbi:MAG: hypothetical protein KAS76_06160, partial [Thermoplasmatales archaeon]|nr:hypothetical protein [Thermoplasmatales archaeon]
MPQFENIAILGRILRTTIDVISRRTSDAYANVIIGNAIKDLAKKYNFLDYVKIQGIQYTEVFDVIDIGTEINNVDLKEIGKAANEFLENIIGSMGKNAGYYFLKEIKEDMSSEYGAIIKEIGVDLDFLQLKFHAELKQFSRLQTKNSEMLRNFTNILFDILDKDYGRTAAFITLNELVGRLGTEYETLRYVQINDIRSVQGVDIVTINSDVDKADSSEVGAAIQRIVQELNNYY